MSDTLELWSNDDATDWLAELAAVDDATLLLDSIGDAADLPDVEPLSIYQAHRALAAVAVVVATLDGDRAGLPHGAAEWIGSVSPVVPNHLARKAGRAVERVLRDSELAESMAGLPGERPWRTGLEALRARLPF